MNNDIQVKSFEKHINEIKRNDKDCMIIITVYNKNTIDYKDQYVARLFKVEPGLSYPTNIISLSNTLEEIRNAIPCELFCFKRHDNDDVNIIENWL